MYIYIYIYRYAYVYISLYISIYLSICIYTYVYLSIHTGGHWLLPRLRATAALDRVLHCGDKSDGTNVHITHPTI